MPHGRRARAIGRAAVGSSARSDRPHTPVLSTARKTSDITRPTSLTNTAVLGACLCLMLRVREGVARPADGDARPSLVALNHYSPTHYSGSL